MTSVKKLVGTFDGTNLNSFKRKALMYLEATQLEHLRGHAPYVPLLQRVPPSEAEAELKNKGRDSSSSSSGSSTAPLPSTIPTNEEEVRQATKQREQWIQKNRALTAEFKLCIVDKYHTLVASCKTFDELFTVLEHNFKGLDAIAEQTARRHVYNYKINKDKPLLEEILKLDTLIEEAQEAGAEFTDKEKLHILENALPTTYVEHLLMIAQAKGHPLSYEQGKEIALSKFYIKSESKKEVKVEYNSEHAMMGKKKMKKYLDKKISSSSSGSDTSDTSSSGSDTSSSSSRGRGSTFIVKCWNCGQVGHAAMKCDKKLKPEIVTKLREDFDLRLAARLRVDKETPKRTSKSAKPRTASFIAVEDERPSETSLFASSLPGNKAEPSTTCDWILDSGCTTHVCNSLEQFDSFQREQVMVRTTSKPVCGLGRGIVKIMARVGGETACLTLNDVVYIPSSPYNTISVSRLSAKGFYISTKDPVLATVCKRDDDSVWMECDSVNGLYLVKLRGEKPEASKPD